MRRFQACAEKAIRRKALAVSDKMLNVLIVMSDDQGPWAANCCGTPELITPNIDRLAAEGMRLENFFCASPVCSPARASFLTGRIPSRHGVLDWLKSGNIEAEEGETWCGKDRPIEYLAGMTGFTDILAEHGYVCGLSGKWHLGASGTPQKGHKFWAAYALGGDSYTNYLLFDNAPKPTRFRQYVTDLITERALDFLERHGKGPAPFCLSVHYTAPHCPWRRSEQPAEVWARYEDCKFESIPVLPPHPWHGWAPTPQERRETLAGYFTTITAMDMNIGRLLAKLDALGAAENTLVIFTSDNGFNVGHHGVLGKGNATWPFNMFEESVKVPFIARCPGRIPRGRVSAALASQYDFMPTLLELVGLPAPKANDTLPGRSFARVLRGETDEGREQVVVFSEYGPTRMIRDAEWKYVHRYPYGPCELYNLRRDPGETRNVLDEPEHTPVLEKMRLELEKWFLRYAAPEFDGSRQPVTGEGQINLVGPIGGGKRVFEPSRWR